MNLEYRFTIFSFFKGALFTDAGNVWLQSKDPLRPGGEFQWNQFLLQFGVDVGAGLRMDFSYFILRFDLGMPVRDPTTYKANKWLFGAIKPSDKDWRNKNLVFNLAIGYPF